MPAAEEFSRTEKLIGAEKLNILQKKKVAVFGLGGVGSYACEALARCGISQFVLVDNDIISLSNINRQLYALHSTIGKNKVEVAKDRILDINPAATVQTYKTFFLKETASSIDLSDCDYIIDCIDTVSAKILLAEISVQLQIPFISSMGTGNKTDPTKFEITQIEKTSVCPLARVMRRELKNRGIKNINVVYSKEEPKNCSRPPASISFVPSVAGLLIASKVVKDLCQN
jgi:tRNA A37 threonylcarbamoyladenosine dehydratase